MSILACQLAVLQSVMIISIHLDVCLTRTLDVKQFFNFPPSLLSLAFQQKGRMAG